MENSISTSESRSNITAIPQLLSITTKQGGKKEVHLNVLGLNEVEEDDEQVQVQGVVVYDSNKPGSVVFGYCEDGQENIGNDEQPYQMLSSSISSSHSAPLTRQFKFFLPHAHEGNTGYVSDKRQGQLMMQIIPVIPGGSKSRSLNENHGDCIPLLIGPGSISIASPLSEAERAVYKLNPAGFTANGIWDDILKGVGVAIPELAKAGLNIYNELTKKKEDLKSGSNAQVGGIFGTIGSLVDVAVPFIAALL